MSYDPNNLVTLQSLKDSISRVKTEYLSSIEEELSSALEDVGGGVVYTGTKTDLAISDTDIISSYFKQHIEEVPRQGDVFIVKTVIEDVFYEMSSYIYNETDWTAITGNVDATKVVMRDNITLAGNYTQVGNLTKNANGTATLEAKGKSVADVLMEILSKRLQPSITSQPSISGFSLSGAKSVEAGTKITAASYTSGTLNPGSYQYGPDTEVVASNWLVQRITDLGTTQVANSDSTVLSSGTDDNGGSGFIIGDVGGENVVSSLKYKAIATHGAGVTANDNLGGESNPIVNIVAGTKEKTTSAYIPYRNYFYGATTDKPELNSEYIRALTKSNKAYASGTITINVPVGAQRVCIACIGNKTGVTKVINATAMNADVTGTFTKTNLPVEGAEGYTSQDYNVWVFEPAVPYENPATLNVTLG